MFDTFATVPAYPLVFPLFWGAVIVFGLVMARHLRIFAAVRAEGRRSTPMAALSRGIVGVRAGALVVNVPGSPRGALESLEAIVPVLEHALETLAGPFDHGRATAAGARPDLPAPTAD